MSITLSPTERRSRAKIERNRWILEHKKRLASPKGDSDKKEEVSSPSSMGSLSDFTSRLSGTKNKSVETSLSPQHKRIVQREIDSYPTTIRKLFESSEIQSDRDRKTVVFKTKSEGRDGHRGVREEEEEGGEKKSGIAIMNDLRASLQTRWDRSNPRDSQTLDKFCRSAFQIWYDMSQDASCADGNSIDVDVMNSMCEGVLLRFDALDTTMHFRTFWDVFRSIVRGYKSTKARVLSRRFESLGHSSDSGKGTHSMCSGCRPPKIETCVIL